MAVIIADLLPEPVEVNVGNGTLAVRGLQLDDLAPLITKYQDDLAQFFAGDGFDAQAMIIQAPHMAADIIAIGAEAVGQEADIRKLPAASQIEALLAIWKISVPDVKKLRESLLGAVASLSLNPQQALEDPSTSTSENTSQSVPSTSSPKDTDSETSDDTP
jgi:hypothetical protein